MCNALVETIKSRNCVYMKERLIWVFFFFTIIKNILNIYYLHIALAAAAPDFLLHFLNCRLEECGLYKQGISDLELCMLNDFSGRDPGL